MNKWGSLTSAYMNILVCNLAVLRKSNLLIAWYETDIFGAYCWDFSNRNERLSFRCGLEFWKRSYDLFVQEIIFLQNP